MTERQEPADEFGEWLTKRLKRPDVAADVDGDAFAALLKAIRTTNPLMNTNGSEN